jgi:hypothetical protein
MKARRCRPLLEPLENRELLATDPNLQFLLNAANQYTFSPDAADLGTPIVPLYTDFHSDGTYGHIDDQSGVSPNLNDNNPARGPSDLLMSWDGSGPNAYFQFGIGTPAIPEVQRVRDIPGWQASAVRFEARGDVAGRNLEVKVFQVSGSTSQLIASSWFMLSTTYQDKELSFPAVAPKDVWAVQFLMDSAHDPLGGSVRLDDVRLDTNLPDPLRVVQSYQALWAPTNSPANTPADRDLNVYPHDSYLYDNALTIVALAASGQAGALQAAQDDAHAILQTGAGDGSFFNVRASGHVLQGDGTARPPLSSTRTLGDNAWFGLALLDLYQLTQDPAYLSAAVGISKWAETLKDTTDAYSGYRGGYDEKGNLVGYEATESNIDLFQLNRRLEVLEGAQSVYAARATWAATFVLDMFDPMQGKFWTGTKGGNNINEDSVPLDAQIWPFLTLGQWPEYARDSAAMGKLGQALAWAETNLVRTDGAFTGFTFSSMSAAAGGGATPVWFEGNAFAAIEYQLLAQPAKAQAQLNLLAQARTQGPNADPNGLGQIAASSDGLVDTTRLGGPYDARLAVAPSAWTYLAGRGLNPFDWLPPIKIFDNGTLAMLAALRPGVAEPAVPLYFQGNLVAIANVVEGYQQVSGTSQYPLTWADIVASDYDRLSYQNAAGTSASLGTSVIGSVSFRTAAGLQLIPSVSRADVSATGSVATVRLTAQFGTQASEMTTYTHPLASVGQTVTNATVSFVVNQPITLDSASFGQDALRVLTVSTMNTGTGAWDSSVLKYGDANGNAQYLSLSSTVGHLFAMPQPLAAVGPWFAALKEPGSSWYPDSPSVRIDVASATIAYPSSSAAPLSLGLEGFRTGSTDPNEDSVTLWPEVPGTRATLPAGTDIEVAFQAASSPPEAVSAAPAFTSADNTTFTVGTRGSFTVAADGYPIPTLSESGADTLPSGVAFQASTGVLSGTPAAGSSGTYTLHFTAHNGVGSDATQTFTLTVNPATQAPAFTSATSTSFVVSQAGSFTVAANGSPTPTLSESASDTLPSGVIFNPASGVLSGTPAAGSSGTYTLHFTAHNGVGPDAGQTLTLTVNPAPVPPFTGDATHLVQVTLTPARRKKGKFIETLTVVNTSEQPLQGPLHVVLRGLRTTVKVQGAAGFVGTKKKRSPFLTLNLNGCDLQPGQSITLTLQFSGKPNRVTISVFAGVPPQ